MSELNNITHKNFSFKRVIMVAQRVSRQFMRDKRTVGMMVVFPIMFMLVFGYVLSGDVKNVPISVDNRDAGFTHPISNETYTIGVDLYNQMSTNDHVNMKKGSYYTDIDKVESVDLVATILIPANFSEVLLTTGNATIIIYIDGTKPQLKAAVYTAISDSLKEVAGGGGITLSETQAFGVSDLSGLDVSIPAVMGYILTFLVMIVAVLIGIREDINKTKFRLFTTPLAPVERILGYGISLSFFALLETSIVMLIAIYLFGAVVHGSVVLLFAAGLLYGVSHIFLAFFLSNFAKNEFQSIQLAIMVAIPSLALSGMMIPVSSFPQWLKFISYVIPLTYGIRIFEGIMLRGWGFVDLWFEFMVTFILTVAFFILALISSSDMSKA